MRAQNPLVKVLNELGRRAKVIDRDIDDLKGAPMETEEIDIALSCYKNELESMIRIYSVSDRDSYFIIKILNKIESFNC